ncbi:hypothetical protein FK535_26185 [Mycolicibacterium sp. 018/SC-01/001]|uniref:DUF4304 domain-containing protein n=1 Tax=Mycolicibacterium sp. 018/SC-01/001 TaxID=2592069 RepID=UPI0011810493|nr:DUF4304 domain-containing protein [Mycolicibacterium sp. 018/SC-01/001]TRW77882.1 hypothetical protein FK535_26185 [Mycolicibacterium sp. 018/SC-01/001]
MATRDDETAAMKRAYGSMLSTAVAQFLGARGFVRIEHEFRRHRGALDDVIDFQENWHNGSVRWHGFFVNVRVASAEVDAACAEQGRVRTRANRYLLSRRWESLVPELPYELRLRPDTDMTVFTAQLCQGLDLLLDALERVDTTAALVRYAVDNNLLIAYETTCCYLAAIDDIETLTTYVATLRDCFGHQERWTTFSREIRAETGRWASTLSERGVLGPVTADS